MRHNQTRAQNPSSVTVQVKPGVSKLSHQSRDLVVRKPRLHERGEGESSKMSKVSKDVPFIIQHHELEAFLKLLDDEVIQDFLWMDSCCRIADKYLLAMVLTYFKRAELHTSQYSRMNFFLALYLANDMEEDEEQYKYEIFPWALGDNWRKLVPNFLKLRLDLWARMNYKAAVSRRCCEEVIATIPCHYIWHRDRPAHHSGAIRSYLQKETVPYPQGPSGTPPYCTLCNCYRCYLDLDSDSSSSSPENTVLLDGNWPQDLLILSPSVLIDHGIEAVGNNLKFGYQRATTMKLLVICSSFFLVTAGSKPQPCDGPKLLEGQMATFDPSKHYEVWSKFSFDGIRKRIYAENVVVMDKGIKVFVWDFFLYNENVMYQFYPQNKTCVKNPLRAPFLPIAIPQNATFVTQLYIGGSSAPGEGMLANVWSGEVGTVHYMVTFTEVGCLPVSELYYTKETGWVTEMFYDLTTGIHDPTVFIPPAECSHLN